MSHMIRLTDYRETELEQIFQIAAQVKADRYKDWLQHRCIVMFFPSNSIRTRVSWEKGITELGGHVILFPTETLDKREDMKDVIGYLNNWADAVIVRHKDITMLERIAAYSEVPVINAMTDCNHPCEILSDLYALSQLRTNYRKDHYLFCGKSGNIGLAWKEAADALGLSLEQCCPQGYQMEHVSYHTNIEEAVKGKDIICTDSLPSKLVPEFQACQVTKAVMERANEGALLNPCPPFYRGEEVSEDAIDSSYFVGYSFKKCLKEVQLATLIYCMLHRS